MPFTLDVSCKTALIWRFHDHHHHHSKTLTTKTPAQSVNSSAVLHLKWKSPHRPTQQIAKRNSNKQASIGETFSRNRGLQTLLRKHSDPLQILKHGGDWDTDQFWAVIRFLRQTSRSEEILQVFDLWKNIEKSRINEFNYEKIIGFLVGEGQMDDAVSVLGGMRSHGLQPSLEVYNLVIHGFAKRGKFEDALLHLKQMEEINLKPDTETYDGLIEAYGNHKMYDEMGKCIKKMESDGCMPDHITYNLLIREFANAGLLKRMERLYQTLISKRMDLQSSALGSMLEAYANFGILGKMEKVYKRALNSKTPLKEDLILKLAGVYVENHMFSRLDDLGLDLSSRTGRTDLVWCLRMLSHACLLSRKGMDSILQEMEQEKVPWNVTIANIILLAYLKMNDLKHLKVVLSELPIQYVKPDVVTFGILFDAVRIGFDAKWTLSTWRKLGFLDEAVEINTDALVLTALGKGHVLRSCEEMYSLEPKARGKKTRTYGHLINLFFRP